MVRKFLYRPIFVFSVVVIIVSFCFGLFNASLSGGGGMAAGIFFAIAIITGFVLIFECFLVKNSAATPKEMLISESVILTVILMIIFCLALTN